MMRHGVREDAVEASHDDGVVCRIRENGWKMGVEMYDG